MCVIVISNKKVKEDIIEKCWHANQYGAGFSVCESDKVYYHRGIMKLNEFLKCYDEEVAEGKKHVLHFRIPSKGDKGVNMTQPFPIEKNYLKMLKEITHKGFNIMDMSKKGYTAATLSHNGTISSIGDNKLSDSFYAAYILSNLKNKSGYGEVLGILSDYSRFAIALPNKVVTVGDFEEYDEMYFSNMFWKDKLSFKYYGCKRYNTDYNTEFIFCWNENGIIDRAECANCTISTEYLCDVKNKE